MNSKHFALLIALALAPLPAAAQGGHAGPPLQDNVGADQSVGPMIFEPIKSGWLFAPDAKITEVDKKTSELVGGYAGRITDNTFFIGGGGYWLVNPSNDRDLGYGGLVLQWLGRTSAPLGFSVKGLVGGGGTSLTQTIMPVIGRFDDDRRRGIIAGRDVRVHTHQAFFIAEPQADLLVRLTRRIRLTVGAGYRFIAADHGDSGLSGPVGTLGVQIGGGS